MMQDPTGSCWVALTWGLLDEGANSTDPVTETSARNRSMALFSVMQLTRIGTFTRSTSTDLDLVESTNDSQLRNVQYTTMTL